MICLTAALPDCLSLRALKSFQLEGKGFDDFYNFSHFSPWFPFLYMNIVIVGVAATRELRLSFTAIIGTSGKTCGIRGVGVNGRYVGKCWQVSETTRG